MQHHSIMYATQSNRAKDLNIYDQIEINVTHNESYTKRNMNHNKQEIWKRDSTNWKKKAGQ